MSDESVEVEGSGLVTELGELALETLRRLLELSNVPGEVELTETRERIRLDVYPDNEDDTLLMIGRQGQTVGAYQFVLNRMVNRSPHGRKPISIDVAGYAEQRKSRLQELAGRLAKNVVASKIDLQILAMNPADRRTVHMALEGSKNIKTWSDGMGIGRRLVVSTQQGE